MAGACALLVLAAVPGADPAGAATPRQYVTGWIPTWSSSAVTNGTAALSDPANRAIIEQVSPFSYSATGAASFRLAATPTDHARAVSAARAAGLKVVPSITDGTGKLVMSGILRDPVQRTAHVNAIAALVNDNGFDGIDLDYEGFAFVDGRSTWPLTVDAWKAFVQELGARLDAEGKSLSVTVPPIWTTSGGTGYWVYSPKEILPFVDRLQLMVYDWSVGSPGPIAPMFWVNDVIATMKTVGPELMAKVQIGVPTYGRSWATITSGTCPTTAELSTVSVLMRNGAALASSKGAVPTRHSSGEMTFTYQQSFTGPRAGVPAPPYVAPPTTAGVIAPADRTALAPALRLNPGGAIVTCTVRRTVFYPDAASVEQRANAAIAAGSGGIAIWALGYETSDMWAALRRIAPS